MEILGRYLYWCMRGGPVMSGLRRGKVRLQGSFRRIRSCFPKFCFCVSVAWVRYFDYYYYSSGMDQSIGHMIGNFTNHPLYE